ncbi:MAG: hypothetical protein Fur0032_08810 [Terrimicrobiaceae bacterium]
MGAVVRRHDDLLRGLFERAGGFVFKTVGDAFCVAFEDPGSAVAAAVAVTRALGEEPWGEVGPVKVRVGIHTGPAEFRGQDYFGTTLSRVARIESAGHGGQILVSGVTVELMADTSGGGFGFRDLGYHLLRSLEKPEHLFQVLADGLPESFPPPRSMEFLPNNLPQQTTSFVGREKEMENVLAALEGTARLVTLVGTGGTGKTRLAMESGARLIGAFPDGVWLAELALVGDASKVFQCVTEAVGVREEPGVPLRETLLSALRNKRLLLILDNCEHLTGSVASLAVELLRRCPGVKLLATSRHSLGIAGENTLAVPPLGTIDIQRDDIRGPGLVNRLLRYDAVKLFLERAISVRPDFEMTADNAAAVAEICSRLDGIPLAIELAAARVRILGAEQIASRLVDRFRLLKGGSADRLPHQQTLQALIDWSYELLSEPERVLFRRLGVFVGGRELEAIEEVCAGPGLEGADILDVLQQLIEKSLVGTEAAGSGELRYTLLESVWHYARQKLAEAGEEEEMRGRHMRYFLDWAEMASEKFTGSDQKKWLEKFNEDVFNFDAAVSWCLRSGKYVEGARFLAALGRPLEVRGYLTEARSHALMVLDHGSGIPASLLAKATAAAARIAWAMDLYDEAAQLYRDTAVLAREAGDQVEAELSEAFLGFFARAEGRAEEAAARFRHGLEASQSLGDLRLRAMSLSGLGRVSLDAGRLDEARDLLEEGLRIYRGLGDHWIVGLILWGVANVAVARGDIRRAEQAICEWAGIANDLGNRWILPYILVEFAHVALAAKAPRSAARFLGGAEALRERFGIQLTAQESASLNQAIEATKVALEPEIFNDLWAEGRATPAEDLVAGARRGICPNA